MKTSQFGATKQVLVPNDINPVPGLFIHINFNDIKFDDFNFDYFDFDDFNFDDFDFDDFNFDDFNFEYSAFESAPVLLAFFVIFLFSTPSVCFITNTSLEICKCQ